MGFKNTKYSFSDEALCTPHKTVNLEEKSSLPTSLRAEEPKIIYQGQKMFFYGQTPTTIRQSQLRKLADFVGLVSVEAACRQILEMTALERSELLRDFYERGRGIEGSGRVYDKIIEEIKEETEELENFDVSRFAIIQKKFTLRSLTSVSVRSPEASERLKIISAIGALLVGENDELSHD